MIISDLKKQLLMQVVFRASSGLYFLQSNLRPLTGSTDMAYSRSRYILLSYCVDLLLNTLLLLSINSEDENEIFKQLKRYGKKHDYESMFKNVLPKVKTLSGIISVTKHSIKRGSNEFFEYHIITPDREVIVQDFVDVRYDFRKKHGKEDGRVSNPNEVEEMKIDVATLLRVTSNLKTLL